EATPARAMILEIRSGLPVGASAATFSAAVFSKDCFFATGLPSGLPGLRSRSNFFSPPRFGLSLNVICCLPVVCRVLSVQTAVVKRKLQTMAETMHFMDLAFAAAQEAGERQEVPIGA